MAGTGDFRVGDAEREAVAAELREHYAQGRLSLDDFQRSLDASFVAKTRSDLDQLISDLPHTHARRAGRCRPPDQAPGISTAAALAPAGADGVPPSAGSPRCWPRSRAW